MLDRVCLDAATPDLRGKGFVFDRVTPREGIRHATVAGVVFHDAGPRQRHSSPDLHGLLCERDDPMDQGAAPRRRHLPRRRRARRLLLADCRRPRRTRRARDRRRAQPRRLFGASRASRGQRESRTSKPATGAWPSVRDRSRCTCPRRESSRLQRHTASTAGLDGHRDPLCGGSTTVWTTGASANRSDEDRCRGRGAAGAGRRRRAPARRGRAARDDRDQRAATRRSRQQPGGARRVISTALGFEPARLVSGRAVRVARADIDLDPAHERDCLFVHGTALGVDARRHGLTAIRPV